MLILGVELSPKFIEGDDKMTTDTQIAIMAMELLALRRELDELKSNGTVKVSGNGKSRKGTKTLDTKTNLVYKSHAACGMAVAPEFGLKVHNFVWYEVLAKVGEGRFKDITVEEYDERNQAKAEVKPELEKVPEKEPVKAQK